MPSDLVRRLVVGTRFDPMDVVPEMYPDIRVRSTQVDYTRNGCLGWRVDLLVNDKGARSDPPSSTVPQYRYVSLLRLTRIAPIGIQRSDEDVALVDLHRNLLKALHEHRAHPITLVANDPDSGGVLFCTGVQADGETPEEARAKALAGVEMTRGLFRGVYRQADLRQLTRDEGHWLQVRLQTWGCLSVFRGLPRPRREAGLSLTTPLAGVTPESTVEQQIEQFARAMADKQYILSILASPLSEASVDSLLMGVSERLSKLRSDVETHEAHSAGISIPFLFAGSLGGSQGVSHGVTTSHGTSVGVSRQVTSGESVGTSTSQTQGTSLSVSHSVGETQSVGTNLTTGHQASLSHSYGQSLSLSQGRSTSHGTSLSESKSVSETLSAQSTHGVTETAGSSISRGSSTSTSFSDGTSTSNTAQLSQSFGVNSSHGVSGSASLSSSSGGSAGTGASTDFQGSLELIKGGHSTSTSSSLQSSGSAGVSAGSSASYGTSAGSGLSIGSSHSSTESFGETTGTSLSQSVSRSVSDSASVSTGQSVGTSQGVTTGQSASAGASVGLTQGASTGVSGSVGGSVSAGQSYSAGVSQGSSTSVAQSQSLTQGVTQSRSLSESAGTSAGASETQGSSSGSSLGSNWATNGSLALAPSVTYTRSKPVFDEQKRVAATILQTQVNRLTLARQEGAWEEFCYLLTPDEPTKEMGVGAAISAFWGPAQQGGDLPVRFHAIVDLDSEENEHLRQHVRSFSSCYTREPSDKALERYAYSTVLTTTELAVLCRPPRIDLPGIQVSLEPIPTFRVPTDADGSIGLGRVVNPEIGAVSPYRFGLKPETFGHTIVAGVTGFGKTVSAEQLFVNFVNQPPRKAVTVKDGRIQETEEYYGALVLDWKRTWRGILQHVPRERFRFVSLWNPESGFKYNPLAVPEGVPPNVHLDSLAEALALSMSLGQRGRGIIRGALGELYRAHRPLKLLDPSLPDSKTSTVFDTPELSRFVGMADLYMTITNQLNNPATAKQGNSLKEGLQVVQMRLQHFAPGEPLARIYTRDVAEWELASMPDLKARFDAGEFSLSGCLDLFDLIGPGTICVMEGGPLDPVVKRFLVTMFVTEVFEWARIQGEGAFTPERLFVLEEAHEVLVSGEDDAAKIGGVGATIWEQIWNEGRSLGMRMMAIVQTPHVLPESVISNSGCHIIHRLSNGKSQTMMLEAIGRDPRTDDRPLKRFLARIPRGQAIVRDAGGDYNSSDIMLVQPDLLVHDIPSDEVLREYSIRHRPRT